MRQVNAAREITRVLRRREQYQTVRFIAQQLLLVAQFLFVAALLYALLVLAMVL